MTAIFQVELLGGFQVVTGAERITRFRTRQTTSLFAYLALHRGKPISREVLAEMFWPDAPDLEKARASLSVAISSLRAQLEKGQASKILQVSPRSLGVFAHAVDLDVDAFERALEAIPSENTSETIQALERALTLFKGTFLPGFYDDWVVREQVRLRDRFIAAVHRVESFHEAEGDIDAAIYWKRQEVAHFPDDYTTLAQLLQLLIEEGRLQEAAQAYYGAQSQWAELSQPPLPEALLQQLAPLLKTYPPQQNSRPRPKPAPPPAPVAPAASKVPALPSHLPALPRELARFVGRERELAQIRKFVKNPETRLLTLIGLGGMGKTRLAVEAGHRLRDEGFATYFVELQNARSEYEFLREIALSLQIPLPTGESTNFEEPVVYVLSSQPSCVLILDNMEQLIETPAQDCLVRLLNRAPHLHCLITTQRRLSLPGERTLPITPLDTPSEEDITLGTLDPDAFEAAWPCVALFVDRARESMPGFHLHAGNLELIARIVKCLEGMPLAVLLTAARIQVLSLPDILKGVSDSHAIVRTTRRVSPERHRSLEASISWSYALLRPELARFFCQLTVFQGTFGGQDVGVVLNEPLALDYLTELCDSSFVTSAIEDKTVRFMLLDSLHRFGQEHLEAQEHARLRQAHAQHFALIAAESERHWRTEQESTWLDRLKSDLANLRAAMSWSLESPEPERLRVASQLGIHLGRFWWVSLLSKDGKEFLTALLSQPRLAEHISLEHRTRLHNSLISQEVVASNDSAVIYWCNKALALADDLGNPKLRASILANLGLTIMRNQEWDEENSFLKEAIEIFEKFNDYPRLISIYHNVSLYALIHERPKIKTIYIKNEIIMSAKNGINFDICHGIQSFANSLLVNSDYKNSIRYYKLCMPIMFSSNHYFGIIGAMSCYLLAEYLFCPNAEVLKKIEFINQYKKNYGIHEGHISKIILCRHQMTLRPVELPSPDLARKTILRWAAEVVPETEISYGEVVQEILAAL